MSKWQPIETAPRDGVSILAYDATTGQIAIVYPKRFPKPVSGYSEDWPRDKWEIFRDGEFAPGHSWSMFPTHWMPLPPTSRFV